ncbi:hypothetical protein [Peribacillus simplex]|uniref:hypothetical protein n=1 Tax=Peribacillus simplex TaxID=1478 RepID=UPI003D2AC8AD
MIEVKPKIYCFINGGTDYFLNVAALAEDGNHLAGHASSNGYFAKHDIGIESDWKHELYKKHYPNGYELVWLDEYEDEGFKKAIEKNKKLAETEENK